MSAEYDIRPLESGDVAGLLESFAEVFGSTPGAAGPRTREQWAWAFERNPAGARAMLAVRDGVVAAQFAALPQRVWIDGRERVFAQAVDSMVHPAHRAGLKRPGLFVEVARACFERWAGRERDLVYYGLPVREAWRIGHRFLGYEVVRTELALVRALESGTERSVAADAPPAGVERIARFDEQAKWLWDRCADEWGASAIRDAAYLNWRLLDAPGRTYTCLGARDANGVLRGVAALRRTNLVVDDLGAIVEWLVPAAEPETAEVLLAALQREARELGASALAALVPPWHPWFGWFQERGFRARATDWRMGAVCFDPRFDAAWLRERWWYQLSDTDLA